MGEGNCRTVNLFLKTEARPPSLPEDLDEVKKTQSRGRSLEKEKDSPGQIQVYVRNKVSNCKVRNKPNKRSQKKKKKKSK